MASSTALANNIDEPRFFNYNNSGFHSRAIDLSFGWFKTLNDEQKLAYNQALMHAVSYADNGEAVRWYKNDASGLAVPSLTWPIGNGYCRRVYIQVIAHGVEKNFKTTACYNESQNSWTWHDNK